jgi:hypothetical protein
MPFAELADSIVEIGRQTLLNAMHMVNMHPTWGARVVSKCGLESVESVKNMFGRGRCGVGGSRKVGMLLRNKNCLWADCCFVKVCAALSRCVLLLSQCVYCFCHSVCVLLFCQGEH